MATNVLSATIVQDSVLKASLARTSPKFNRVSMVPAVADSSGNILVSVNGILPATYTALIGVMCINNGSIDATAFFKNSHGGATVSANLPAGEMLYLPSIDYTNGVVLTTASGQTQVDCYLLYSV